MKNINQWEQYFKDRGIAEEYVNVYLSYIEKLLENKMPIIFEYEHLSYLLGINKEKLLSLIHSPQNFYRTFYIPKRSGGKREISTPLPSLLSCQKWIYENILLHTKTHKSSHGFTKQKSIFTNAKEHLNKKALLKMDLKDFFPSIPISWVIKYFYKLGYSPNICFYLASLCCYKGYLSQGSVTSPYLSNILLIGLDNRLEKLSMAYQLTYTRYADDLTFSGEYIPHKFSTIVSDIVENFGLLVNDKKTRLHLKPGQRIVTGLSVSGTELTVPREFKRKIKQEVHYIEKYGFLSHLSKLKINNPTYLDHLIGKLNYWQQAEPNNTYIKNTIVKIRQIKNSL